MESKKTEQIELSKVLDIIFVAASVLFFIFISGIFLATKFGYVELRWVLGILTMCLIIPYIVVLIGYVKEKPEKPVIVSLGFILFFLLLELIWDYILRIPFRDILALHIVYIIFLYVASFNMIGVSFRINKKMGWIVTITFWISLGCLIYLYLF